MRIVSLVPSWTEYVVDLGCASELIGRTKFCVRAGQEAERISIIGGTKSIHLDRIEQLKPDLVIASKEENTRKDIEACRAFSDVLVTDVRTIPDAFEALETIGAAIEKVEAGISWRSNIEKHGESLASSILRHFTPSGKIRSWLPATTRTFTRR